MNAAGLFLPTPLPIASLVTPPDVLAPAVPLERRLVLSAEVGRCIVLDRGPGLVFGPVLAAPPLLLSSTHFLRVGPGLPRSSALLPLRLNPTQRPSLGSPEKP